MTIDFEELKRKYSNRERADISDIEIVLPAVPFLVREVNELKIQLNISNSLNEEYQKKIKAAQEDKSKVSRLQFQLSGAENKIKDLEKGNGSGSSSAENERLQNELKVANDLMEGYRNQIDEAKKQKVRVSMLEMELSDAKKKIKDFKKNGSAEKVADSLNGTAELSDDGAPDYKSMYDKLLMESKGKDREINLLSGKLSTAEDKVSKLKNSNHTAGYQEQIEKLKNKLELARTVIREQKKMKSSADQNKLISQLNLALKKSEEQVRELKRLKTPDTDKTAELLKLKKQLERADEIIRSLKDRPAVNKINTEETDKLKEEADTLKKELKKAEKIIQKLQENNDVSKLQSENDELKNKLESAEKIIKEFKQKRPPQKKSGNVGNSSWEVEYDDEKNLMYFVLNGDFDSSGVKRASRCIESVLVNARNDFHVICDISKLESELNRKISFQMKKVVYNMQSAGIKKMVRIPNPRIESNTKIFDCVATFNSFDTFDAQDMDGAVRLLEG